ncbi:hypothetical protein FRC02_011211 [Tulasnella sp. 418]|nr:hypothetical protein FRC02_011211 [Tulasnella sp. 418]
MSDTSKDCPSPLEAGTYIIRSTLSKTPLNVVLQEDGKTRAVCIWKTTRSPTQLWRAELTKKGYRFRNVSTNTHLSYGKDKKPEPLTQVVAIDRPIEWHVQAIDDYFLIKLASNPKLGLDVQEHKKQDGTNIILFDAHGDVNQRWRFEKAEDKQFSIDNKFAYVGQVPAGVYWLGQPHEGGGAAKVGKAPSKAALSVAAFRPLKEDLTTTLHLSVAGVNGPGPNQIWAVEPGAHGYRLKNIGTNSYLNCVDRVLVMESALRGIAGVAEWVFKKNTSRDPQERPDWW